MYLTQQDLEHMADYAKDLIESGMTVSEVETHLEAELDIIQDTEGHIRLVRIAQFPVSFAI